jgi:CSLREA domain-containing protein
MIWSAASMVMWVDKARTIAFWLVALLVVASIGLFLGTKTAHADAFTVNSTGDVEDNNRGDGSCFTGVFIQVGPRFARECTLRAAIEEVNANDEADTIGFLSGLSGIITLSGGQLTVANDSPSTDDLIIQGPGARTITVSGNDASRVFQIDASAHATIGGLTISGGRAELGGGIYNDGTLTLTDSTVSDNKAIVGPSSIFGGGGVYNSGILTLSNSTVSGNVATFSMAPASPTVTRWN